jgi:hypothetical protein
LSDRVEASCSVEGVPAAADLYGERYRIERLWDHPRRAQCNERARFPWSVHAGRHEQNGYVGSLRISDAVASTSSGSRSGRAIDICSAARDWRAVPSSAAWGKA